MSESSETPEPLDEESPKPSPPFLPLPAKILAEQREGKIAARRLRVAEQYVKGWSVAKIALLLGCNPPTIAADLAVIRDEWRKSRVGYMDRVKNEQLEKIDRLECEANEAWEKSKGPLKTTTITEDEDGNTVTKIERRETAGDVQFLTLVDRCIDRRCKILGQYAPVESSVTATVTHYEQPQTREQLFQQIAERLAHERNRTKLQSPAVTGNSSALANENGKHN